MLSLKPRKKETGPIEAETTVMYARSGSAAQQNRRNIPLIVGREYKARVKKRSFVISTIAITLILVAGAFVPTIIEALSVNSQSKVVVINTAGATAGQDVTVALDNILNQSRDKTTRKKDFEVTSAQPGEKAALRQRVHDDKLDVLVTVGRNAAGDLTFDYYTNASTAGVQTSRVSAAISQLNFTDKLARSGVPQSQLASLYTPPELKATSTAEEATGRTPTETLAAYFVAFAGVVLIYIVVTQYGVMVAQGAAEEKSNRIMEIMINAATPFQLMIGKIVGIGLSGVTQMSIVLVAASAALLAQAPLKSVLVANSTSNAPSLDIASLSLGMLLMLGIYFVLGFLLYGALYAAVGSLVSRQEDVQSALGPLTILLLVSYMLGIFGLQAPDSSWVVALSFFPFSTPILMLTRIGVGTVSTWEVLLSLVIMVVSIAIMLAIATRVYRAGVLMYGQKADIGKLFKLARSK